MVQPINGSGSSWKGSQANTEEWVSNIDIESIYENFGTAGIIKIKAGLEKVLATSPFTLSQGCRSKINDLLSQIDNKSKLPASEGKSKLKAAKEAIGNFVMDNTQWMNDNWNIGGLEVNKWAIGATVAAETILTGYGLAAGAFSAATPTIVAGTGVTTAASNPAVQKTVQNVASELESSPVLQKTVQNVASELESSPMVQKIILKIPKIFTNKVGLISDTQKKLVELAPKSSKLTNLVNQYVRQLELFRQSATNSKAQSYYFSEMQSLKGQIESAIGAIEKGQAFGSMMLKRAAPAGVLGGITWWGVKEVADKKTNVERQNIILDIQKGIAEDKKLPPGYKVTGADAVSGSFQIKVNYVDPKGEKGYLLINSPIMINEVSDNKDGKTISISAIDEDSQPVQTPPYQVVRDN